MPLAPSALRQLPPDAGLAPDPLEVLLEDGIEVDPAKDLLRVELPDGAVVINLGGASLASGDASKHDENLADHIGSMALASIAENLLRLIEDDARRQDERMRDIAKGLELLGIKLEEPRTEPNAEGMSVVRHPLLLEAVLRFQANARGELLPADGPVKTRDDGTSEGDNDEANALAKDMNHYLTSTAVEYYPDTDRMLFSLGFGGEAYKKVYFDPVKRRPVSRTVDRKDLILSEGAVSLEDCGRVTHRCIMRPSEIKRMQIAGAWRDVPLTQATLSDSNPTDMKLAQISGVAPKTSIEPEEQERVIYECYCELQIPGFEQEGADGLALPYRVTIEKESREILEVRRWWEEGDEMFLRREVFVEYVFVPAMPGVNIGLLHILGNASRALTAAWRIALDNGMFANFPGGIQARVAGRQQTSNIRIAPGQTAAVDTDGVPLRDAFMALPYRDVTPGFAAIIKDVEQTAQRVGGTAETATGEGRSDAPVGTTIALIEQATKVLNAVHKRCHQAQAKEFQLLKKLFREAPESLWRGNNEPHLPQDAQVVIQALNNNNIVPAADPNTASQTMRVQKAIAIKTLAQQTPALYDMAEVDKRILRMIGVEDIDGLFNTTAPQAPAPDPSKIVDAQAKMLKAQADLAKVKVSAMDALADAENRAADRGANERIERMKLAREQIIHPGAQGLVEGLIQGPAGPEGKL